MAEDNNLVIQKNTFQTCFYEIQLNYDNAKLTNFVSKLSFGKDDQNMSTFFDEKNIINNSSLDDFKKFLITHLQIICEKIYNKGKIEISNSWFQAYGLDNQHEMHVHGISENSFSLIYYVQATENSSSTTFYKPGFPYVLDTDSIKDVVAETGKLVIFPGYLPHKVKPNKDQERIIFSANFRLY